MFPLSRANRLGAIVAGPTRSFQALAGRHQTAATLLVLATVWHIATLASLGTGFLDGLFNDSTRRLGQGADFFAVYQAGSNFLHNTLVYQWSVDELVVPYRYGFRYVPSMAYTIGLAANLLGPWQAYWAWVALNELLLLANVHLTWRFTPEPRLRLLGSAMWLAFTPVYLEFFMGQFSFLMATLIFWMGLGFARSSFVLAGTFWALSLVIKSNTLIFIPIWVRMRSVSVLLASFAFAAALNAPYFLLKSGSFDAWKGNFSKFLGDERAPSFAGALGFQNLLSVLEFLSDERPGLAIDIGASIAANPLWVPLIVSLSALATFSPGKFDPITALAVWVAAYFLIYSDVWEHQYVMLLPALVLLVTQRPRFAGVAFVVYLLVALPTPYWLFEELTGGSPPDLNPHWVSDPQAGWSSLQIIVYHMSKAIPTFVLWLVLVSSTLREARWPWRQVLHRPTGNASL